MVDLFSVSTLSLEKFLELQPPLVGWGMGYGASRLLPQWEPGPGGIGCMLSVSSSSHHSHLPYPLPRAASGGDASSMDTAANIGYLRRGCL